MKLLYVDPMSRNNLGVYDMHLLENIQGKKYFFASEGFQFAKISNTEIVYNYCYYKKKGTLKVASYAISQLKLLKWVLNNNPDIIHIQWMKLPLLDIVILFLVKLFSKKSKLVYTAHNLLPHGSNLKWNIHKYYFFYRLFNGIIVHAESTKKELVDLFNLEKTNIVEIPHGVLKYEIDSIEERMYPGKIVFSFTGTMNHYKGIDILVDTWIKNKMLIENSDIHLIIAGAGNIPIDEIPKGKNITIINRFLTDEEYQLIIHNTDVGILPYRKISQSGVLLSLLAEHKPVIVSNCGGLTQPFIIGKVGWVIDELSSETLLQTIHNVILNKEELFRIQNDSNTWNKIDCYYSWINIGKSTYDFYSLLVST